MSTEFEVIEKIDETIKVQIPKMYKVILHNDNSTTFEFVIAILTRVFYKSVEEAYEITKNIHHTGQGIAGAPFTREIAEEKSLETVAYARANGFPLVATFEEL